MNKQTIKDDNGRRHHVMLMEAGEISGAAKNNPKWMKHQLGIHAKISLETFEKLAEIGEQKYVERSEAFLSQIEDQIPVTRGWQSVDDVVGGCPNIPAYLAGHPQSMRRRRRVAKETAPLTIFMDLTSSMGIDADDILKRGIVLLTLVRLLVEHRPVELWVGTSLGLGSGQDNCIAAWKIDTAPMDLARAAFHIADVNMSRLFGYAMCEQMLDCHIGGYHTDEAVLKKVMAQAGGWGELLYIPPVRWSDPMKTEPVQWLKSKMKEYVREGDDE
jgi:hypothetical protein